MASASEAQRANALFQQQRRDAARARVTADANSPEAAKLQKDIDRSKDTFVFTIALALALTHDLGDFIPLFGQVGGPILAALNWWFLTSNDWFRESETQLRALYLWLAFFVDSIPVVNMLPLNTLIVLYAWSGIQDAGKAAQKRLAELRQTSPVRARAI